MEAVEGFWKFVQERDAIRQRREAGQPQPWTADPVLQRQRICNIFRDLDRGTVLYCKVVQEHLTDYENLVLNTILYRQVSNRDAWFELGWQYDFKPETLRELYTSRKSRKLPFFTGGLTSPTYSGAIHGETTIDRMVNAAAVWQHKSAYISQGQGAHEVFDRLRELPGIGVFYSWMITTDLAYFMPFSTDEWCHLGPGAWAGLREIHGVELFVNMRKDGKTKKCGFAQPNTEQAEYALPYLQKLRDEQPDLKLYRQLDLTDIEHALCEYSKYRRHQRGERAGTLFIPRSA